jgi:hypothetical protein
MTSEFKPGIVVPLAPFFGSMGVAPAPERGRVSSNPPGRHAGNLDNRELVAGSTLYIPVFVPGALFAIGDGHAAQGVRRQVTRVVKHQLRVALAVRVDHRADDPQARALRVEIFTVAGLRACRDDPFDVEFVAVEEEADE